MTACPHFARPSLVAALIAWAPLGALATTTLYDPALLSGTLRDYTAFGFPYTVPNFLFLGDNSARGSAISHLGEVSLSPVPEPAAACLLALGPVGLALRRR